jgi:hypothetical protein
MNKFRDYIPANQGEFDKFFKNITQYVAAKASGTNSVWKHIPKEDQDSLNAAYTAWYTAYAVTLKPHSPVETAEKNRVKKAVVKHLREFVNRFLRHKPVTDTDRDVMGVRNPDRVRTAISVPFEQVEFSYELKGIRRVGVHFKQKGSPGRARPYGYNGAIMKWQVSDKIVTRVEELTSHDLATRTPYIMKFNDEDRGKTLSVACKWENRKSQKGPWSEILSTIVP